MVNRNADSVYQTEELLDLISHSRRARRVPASDPDETVQSTSMFRNFTLALLGSASCLCAGIQQAAAIDGAAPSEPKVLYARDAVPPPAPVRVATNNMGGGF